MTARPTAPPSPSTPAGQSLGAMPCSQCFLGTPWTLEEVSEYIAGFAMGPYDGPKESNQATIWNALLCMNDPCDGIAAWKNRRSPNVELLGSNWTPKKGGLPWKVTDVFASKVGTERTAVQIEKYQGGRNSPQIISVKRLKRFFSSSDNLP